MALHHLAQLISRVAGIVLLVNVIGNGAALFGGYLQRGLEPGVGLSFIVYLVFLVFAAVLIIFPAYISSIVLPAFHGQVKDRAKSPDIEGTDATLLLAQMLPLAASLAGLYFLFTAVSEFVYHVTHWLATRELNPVGYTRYWTVEKIAEFLKILVEVLAGLWLLFGAKGLVKLTGWVRGVHPEVK